MSNKVRAGVTLAMICHSAVSASSATAVVCRGTGRLLCRARPIAASRRRGLSKNKLPALSCPTVDFSSGPSYAQCYPPVPSNQTPRCSLSLRGRKTSAQHEGECHDESSCSRSSRHGAFSGCRIGPAGVPQLRLRTLCGPALRLCRSSLAGRRSTRIASVQPTDLRTTTLRTDPSLPSTAGGAWLLHSAVSRGFAPVI